MNDLESRLHPRKAIQEHLLRGEIAEVLEMAGMLHGHYCPGLALGVKAVECGFSALGIDDNSGMEEVMAVAECNNCFVDGIQFAAGCSLGNNALVYQDLGKTAVTLYRRSGDEAVRLCVKSFEVEATSEERRREGDELFEKAVKRRETLSDQESRRMKELWIERSFATAAMPADRLFTQERRAVPRFAYAPILDSQQCSACGEKVMESKAGFRNGSPVCASCGGLQFGMVLGTGIVTASA